MHVEYVVTRDRIVWNEISENTDEASKNTNKALKNPDISELFSVNHRNLYPRVC